MLSDRDSGYYEAKENARAKFVAEAQSLALLRKHPLIKNTQTPTEVFEYLISIMTVQPVVKTYSCPALGFKEVREIDADSIPVTTAELKKIHAHSQLLITRLAMLIHTEILVTAEIGREVDLSNQSRRIKIKLHGSDLIESEWFAECLSELISLDAVHKAVHTVFIDLASHQHPMTQDPLSELLKSITTSRIHGEAPAKPIKSNRTLSFDDSVTIQNTTNQMVLTLFVGHLLTEICLVLLPTTWIAIKFNASHIDFITSSRYEAGISFVPAHEANTEYRYVKYRRIDGYPDVDKEGVIGVISAGMFDTEKLSMILAQHNQCSRVDIISWEEVKDKAAYDAYNA